MIKHLCYIQLWVLLRQNLFCILVSQVCTYLTSKSWETRIAAGQAVEAIAKNVKKWQPGGSSSRQPSPSSVTGPAETEEAATSKESSPTSDKDSDLLTFETFDLNQVMSIFTLLPTNKIPTCIK